MTTPTETSSLWDWQTCVFPRFSPGGKFSSGHRIPLERRSPDTSVAYFPCNCQAFAGIRLGSSLDAFRSSTIVILLHLELLSRGFVWTAQGFTYIIESTFKLGIAIMFGNYHMPLPWMCFWILLYLFSSLYFTAYDRLVAKEKHSNLMAEIRSLEQQIQSLEARPTAQKVVGNMQNALDQKTQSIITRKMEPLERQINSLDQNLSKERIKMQSLERQIQSLDQNSSQEHIKIRSLERQIQSLDQNSSKEGIKMRSLERQIQSLDQNSSKERIKMRSLERQIQSLDQNSSKERIKMRSLERQIQSLDRNSSKERITTQEIAEEMLSWKRKILLLETKSSAEDTGAEEIHSLYQQIEQKIAEEMKTLEDRIQSMKKHTSNKRIVDSVSMGTISDIKTVQLVIPNFELRGERFFESPILRAHGYKWSIRVYPEGQEYYSSEGYMAVFVNLRGPGKFGRKWAPVSAATSFRCEGSKILETTTNPLQKLYRGMGMGFYNVFKREDVLSDCLLEDGSLVIEADIQVMKGESFSKFI